MSLLSLIPPALTKMSLQWTAILCLVVFVSGTSLAQRAPVPPAPGPMLDIANKLVDAINKPDASILADWQIVLIHGALEQTIEGIKQ